ITLKGEVHLEIAEKFRSLQSLVREAIANLGLGIAESRFLQLRRQGAGIGRIFAQARRREKCALQLQSNAIADAEGKKEIRFLLAKPAPKILIDSKPQFRWLVLEPVEQCEFVERVDKELAFADVFTEHRRRDASPSVG